MVVDGIERVKSSIGGVDSSVFSNGSPMERPSSLKLSRPIIVFDGFLDLGPFFRSNMVFYISSPQCITPMVVEADCHRLTYLTTSDTQDDPLDLSILFSGGKETKRDSPSNGE